MNNCEAWKYLESKDSMNSMKAKLRFNESQFAIQFANLQSISMKANLRPYAIDSPVSYLTGIHATMLVWEGNGLLRYTNRPYEKSQNTEKVDSLAKNTKV